jgi:hypothetical protein
MTRGFRGQPNVLVPAAMVLALLCTAFLSAAAQVPNQGGSGPEPSKQDTPAPRSTEPSPPDSSLKDPSAKVSVPLPPGPLTSGPSMNAPHTPLGEAMVLERMGNCDAAIPKYRKVIEAKPMSPDAYAGITRCYLKKRDVTQAYETATKGLKVSEGWPLQVAMAEVHFRQGKISQAETEWAQVINTGHKNAARAYLGLARVRWALQLNKSAKTMIDKAHALDPDDSDIQKDWIGTLPRAERIKYYENSLADATNTNIEERTNTERYLTYLKERAKEHSPPCRLASKVTNTTTPLVRLLADPQHLRGYGLTVNLNGTRTKIMLDTGASGITVKRQTAERAGITKLVTTNVSGIGDQKAKSSYVGTAKSIKIGELEFQDCPVEVIEGRSVADEDGLIGADVFEDFLVEIDFPNEKLKLSALPKRPGESVQQLSLKNDEDDSDDEDKSEKADDGSDAGAKKTASPISSGPQDRYIAQEMQSFTRIYRFGHDILVPTKVGDVQGMLFVMDSGALTNSISPEAAREVTKVHGDSDTRVTGLNGSVKNVFSANKAVLQFGRLRQENQDMIAFDMTRISESLGTEVSGFFGFTLLRFLDIKIDYRDALVDFGYDNERFGRH